MGKVRSKLDGDSEQPPAPPPRPIDYGYRQRGSTYDADPRILSDDFSHINIEDHTGTRDAPRPSHRPLANPDLFKSTRFSNSENPTEPPKKPPRPLEENPTLNLPPQTQSQGVGGPTPSKKWEPLRPAEDRDPFALGDSDDEERDDLYGSPSANPHPSAIGIQEQGVIETPLDPAVSGPGTKSS